MSRRQPTIWAKDDAQAIAAYKRVLRMVNRYIFRKKNQHLLLTDGRGLMTYSEIRTHVRGALALKVRKPNG